MYPEYIMLVLGDTTKMLIMAILINMMHQKHETFGIWYSGNLATLFEHGHFQEKLQIKNSIILLQRHFRKDFSSIIVSYIVFNSPSSFF